MRSMMIVSNHRAEETTMKTRDQSRLASSLTLLVGLWVVLSPMWISVSSDALASVIITGLVIVAASIAQYFWDSVVPSWIMGLAAVWLFVSTLVYGVSAAAAWSQILAAVAVVALAYWDGVEVAHLRQDGTHHRPSMS